MFDGRAFIALARALYESPPVSEAIHRTIVSRAYYGTFLVAREKLPEQDRLPMGKQDSHSHVWNFYRGAIEGKANTVGFDGFKLRDLRNDADYETEAEIGARESEHALLLADKMVRNIDALKGVTPRRA